MDRLRRALLAVTPLVVVATAGWNTLALAVSDKNHDTRPSFETDAYFGFGIDTFAADDLRHYLNPDDSNRIQERGVGGIDFAFRPIEWEWTGRNHRHHVPCQIWIYGETVHGVRSIDIDATQATTDDKFRGFDLTNAPGKTLYIIHNATSLEAFGGVRFEFGETGDSAYRAHPYVYAQGGGLSVTGGTGDIIDEYDAGGGLVMSNGPFRDSFLQLGHGWNDAFHGHESKRWKIDALLSCGNATFTPFIEITTDFDMKSGPDAMQTYLGVSYEPGRLFSGSSSGDAKTQPADDSHPQK